MADPFAHLSPGLADPAGKLIAVTPSDDDDLADGACRCLWANVGGDLTVIDLFGNEVLIVAPSGAFLPFRVTRVKATGTTATGIVALY